MLRFWFEELSPARWWRVDPELDRLIHDHFGRHPHRNQILGRASTDEERAFLEQPGSSVQRVHSRATFKSLFMHGNAASLPRSPDDHTRASTLLGDTAEMVRITLPAGLGAGPADERVRRNTMGPSPIRHV